MTRIPSPTAALLAQYIKESTLSQREIATRAGYERPNILSMMKTGESKVPISRIPALCKAMSRSPKPLLDMALQEYHPEMHETLQAHYSPTPSVFEHRLLRCLQDSLEEQEIPWSDALSEALTGVFKLAANSELRDD